MILVLQSCPGHWGTGFCVWEEQTRYKEPDWQYQDHTPDGGGAWFIGEGFWKYSFGMYRSKHDSALS